MRILRNRLLLISISFLFLFVVAACGSAKNMNDSAPAPSQGIESSKEMGDRAYDMNISLTTTSNGTTANSVSEEAKGPADRKLILNINMTLQVEDVNLASQTIKMITEQNRGFIQDSRVWDGSQSRQGYMTVRIPADKLGGVQQAIEELGKVKDAHTGTQDVTEEYVDRDSRLRNLQRQEERYLEILDGAKTTEDVLRVEKELVRVREQIEVLTGQLKYLDHQVNYATIYIQLQETKGLAEVTKPSFAKAIESAKTATQNSVNMILTAITMIIIAGGYLLPLIPIILLVGYLYYRWARNRKSNGKHGNDE